jgi:hypothetical protein
VPLLLVGLLSLNKSGGLLMGLMGGRQHPQVRVAPEGGLGAGLADEADAVARGAGEYESPTDWTQRVGCLVAWLTGMVVVPVVGVSARVCQGRARRPRRHRQCPAAARTTV